MDIPGEEATMQLLRERAAREWLRGEVHAVAWVGDVDGGRYRVRGLDPQGNPYSVIDRVIDAFDEVSTDGVWTVVHGDHPGCLAVQLAKAVRHDHTYLTITPSRVAVLRLRDVRNKAEDAFDEVVRSAGQDRSLGGLARGVTRLMKHGAAELAASARRAPLAERPDDAVLECSFEVPRTALNAIEAWKPRLMPRLPGGPRWVQLHLADRSWVCLQTDGAGLAALVG